MRAGTPVITGRIVMGDDAALLRVADLVRTSIAVVTKRAIGSPHANSVFAHIGRAANPVIAGEIIINAHTSLSQHAGICGAHISVFAGRIVSRMNTLPVCTAVRRAVESVVAIQFRTRVRRGNTGQTGAGAAFHAAASG